eukprot:COSAG02_NODE_3164_length_7246_cov_6.628376_4_plen_143_part_00
MCSRNTGGANSDTDAASRLTAAERNGEDAQLYIPSENVVDQRKCRWVIYKVEDGVIARYLCVHKPAAVHQVAEAALDAAVAAASAVDRDKLVATGGAHAAKQAECASLGAGRRRFVQSVRSRGQALHRFWRQRIFDVEIPCK